MVLGRQALVRFDATLGLEVHLDPERVTSGALQSHSDCVGAMASVSSFLRRKQSRQY